MCHSKAQKYLEYVVTESHCNTLQWHWRFAIEFLNVRY